MNLQNSSKVSDRIGFKMAEDKEFCFSIVNCKDREEVKVFLKANGISADDADVDDLAKNISEVADICARLDDDTLEKIVGGAKNEEFKPKDTSHVFAGIGVGCVVLAGLGVLSVFASWIKKKGDEKGWWTKKKA